MKSFFGSLLYLFLRALSAVFAVFRWLEHLWFKSQQKLGWEPDLESSKGARWKNITDNQFCHPYALVRPITLDELCSTVRQASREQRHVRAVGSGHSFSDVAITDDYVVDMHGLNRVLTVDREVLRDNAAPETLFRVESGIALRDLNRRLNQAGLALRNMGSYDAQTVSGAISTGTHGSGVGIGPMCEMVEAVELITGDGERVIIEPRAGITEPARYALKHPDGPRLVKDDDLFYSVVVSMGCMGIVYAYTLRARPRFLLKETRTRKEWSEVREELLAGEHTRVAHYEVYVNPYPVRGKHWCVVTRREETTEVAKSVEGKSRNPISTMLTRFRFIDGILLWAFRHLSPFTPYFINGALSSLSDKLYVDESFKVFNLGDANHVPAFSSELAFDTAPRPGESVPAYIAAVEQLMKLACEQAACGRWHTVPFSLRFIQKSKHYLAPQYGRDTCMVEIPFLRDTPGAWDLLRYYERQFVAHHGARPHWGQAHFLVCHENTRNSYEKFDAFIAVFGELNPEGVFDNDFTQRLSLRSAFQREHVAPHEVEVPATARSGWGGAAPELAAIT